MTAIPANDPGRHPMRIARPDPFEGLESIVRRDVPLRPFTWYRIGGPARYLVQPESLESFQAAAQRCYDNEIPTRILGLGANILVSDAGVDGAVFRLDQDYFRTVRFSGAKLEVGAGVDMQKLVLRTVRQGLAGIECLAGIPGTVGGGVRMNAGGKYGDFGEVLTRVTTMDAQGQIFQREKDDLIFDYRSTNISEPYILGAQIELEPDDPDAVMKRTKEIWMFKRNTQPLNTKNAGCVFKNPRGLSAGALIDQAGLKGTRIGNAEISAKHANFVIAHPGCAAADVQAVIDLIRERVHAKHQIELETEVKIWA